MKKISKIDKKDFNSRLWVRKFLAYEHLEEVENAIAIAEQKTAAEIVPVIVQRSINISHVPLCLFLILVICSMTVAPWVAGALGIELWICEIVGLAVSWFLSRWLARLSPLQRAFVSETELEKSVAQRAELEFFESNIKGTKNSTGVLIFVSLLERRVVILADEAIAELLPKETWSQAVGLLIAEIQKQQLGSGLQKVIRTIGEILSPLYPAQARNPDELANHLVLRDF